LLTIDVGPFLSIAADTPTAGRAWDGSRIEPLDGTVQWSQLCGRRRMTTLSGGMMPFGKIEKSLHEGR
jgi:hypothetical protein